MNEIFRSVIAMTALLLSIAASGERRIHIIESPNLHCNDTVVVYSPEASANHRDCPALFLLHGWGGKWSSWEEHSDLQAVSNRFGFRIICPDGFKDSWYINKTDETGILWRNFFWDELWPLMESEYGLNPTMTFIDGLSMGGHGAINIFLDRPDLFAGAGSMSGVLDLKYSAGSKELIPPMVGATHIEDPECKAIGAIHRLERLVDVCGEGASGKVLVISCGSSDTKFLPASEDFVRKCLEMNLKHIALFSPGKHRWNYWTWVLPYHIDWFSQNISDTTR